MDRFEELIVSLMAFGKLDKNCSIKVSEEIGIADLQIKQINYVNIIGSKEWITHGELAEILEVTKPSVTSIVNKLIHAGIVEKHQCNQDGRVYYLKLTEKGTQIYENHNLVAKKKAYIIVERLSEKEISDFIDLMNKIIK